jgi:hypothetical protein
MFFGGFQNHEKKISGFQNHGETMKKTYPVFKTMEKP